MNEQLALRSRIVKADDAAQIAYGVVLEPCTADNPDAQGDWYTATDIAKAAHGFMARLAKSDAGADLMHEGEELVGTVVESFIAPADMTLGDQVVKAGSWVAGVHYPDPEIWALVAKGELAAFSVGGTGKRIFA
jgi:hypothetical protein